MIHSHCITLKTNNFNQTQKLNKKNHFPNYLYLIFNGLNVNVYFKLVPSTVFRLNNMNIE